jgi:hypothetical protein
MLLNEAGFTNATVVDDAIRFVSSNKYKQELKSSSGNTNEDDKEESNEHNYDEDEDWLEEKQEEETGGMTINQVFWLLLPHFEDQIAGSYARFYQDIYKDQYNFKVTGIKE